MPVLSAAGVKEIFDSDGQQRQRDRTLLDPICDKQPNSRKETECFVPDVDESFRYRQILHTAGFHGRGDAALRRSSNA